MGEAEVVDFTQVRKVKMQRCATRGHRWAQHDGYQRCEDCGMRINDPEEN